MRLFWREHCPLVLFYSVQMLLVPLLYWMTGDERPPSIVLYGILLSMFILVLYLGYRYFTERSLYRQLSQPTNAGGYVSLRPLGEAPLPEAVGEFVKQVDRLNQEELHYHRSRMEHHIVFIHRWVHQMKTPLSVIQLTVQEIDDPAKANSILEEVDRLRKGMEMVLHTSRLDRFEHDIKVEKVNLQQLIHQAFADNRKLFIRKRLTPVIQIDPEIHVLSDKKWLFFIVGQLLVNAVNYTQGAGKKVYVEVKPGEDMLILSIRDEGIGILKEDIGRVFNPYFTGERGRQYHESTGMGLYLVSEACKRLGHGVEIASEPDQGTEVSIIFKERVRP
ncbi:hypothetical protein DCC85_10275 [Paenibacillus sp. CAA11]|uniref:sensor histidine kinase n=1 Tax=Paenibacillus sp. CAA11 TaxID=1532905 RepID=UPI000D3A5AD7|nr:sensor histidine kinase [Paenibacillus sp. CAA11]AWB44574.1 hypothetical protein DCC85_10275 [Paenibacillus sp. CAA11]